MLKELKLKVIYETDDATVDGLIEIISEMAPVVSVEEI